MKIIDEIDAHGQASLTRLTVLKKWFERPKRLSAFAIWVAARAVSRRGKTSGAAAALFLEARTLLAGLDKIQPKLERQTAQRLHDRLRDFQHEYKNQQWGPVRIVHNWNLLLVEEALGICLWHTDSPSYGYKLAADYCRHYDSRYGEGLNGPSRTKLNEIVRFMFTVEALEDGRTSIR
ncbi:MAG: hypothetical protein AAB308_16445 [Nitrospirota bacterium]